MQKKRKEKLLEKIKNTLTQHNCVHLYQLIGFTFLMEMLFLYKYTHSHIQEPKKKILKEN
jgi:hypothetical protein